MTHQELREHIDSNRAIILYFSTPNCGVCKVLRPKVEALLSERFPALRFLYVDASESPEAAAQESVFTVPTVVVHFDGKEHLRKSRHFGVEELADDIERPYRMLFSD